MMMMMGLNAGGIWDEVSVEKFQVICDGCFVE
jgi:hypothetical protein